MKIAVIHGPNLNLLGTREPEKYGHKTSEDLLCTLREKFAGLQLDYFQSNDEGALVNAIQDAAKTHAGILINPGAYSHTSIAMADAIMSVHKPVICVHITHIFQRESYRQTDIVGEACEGSIVGLGIDGYELALECLIDYIQTKPPII